ncbi:MAG: hypothetical protein QE285_19245, partial [Aquabacterium sp.]|nr:hypothetical protein [Aquabacterium sp.]
MANDRTCGVGISDHTRGVVLVKSSPDPDPSGLRVTKKLSPDSRGAIKLARRFGDALVCVRHRTDDRGEFRYTTVELLVEKTNVVPRTDKIVAIRVGADEKPLQTVVRAAGGTWDHKARVWALYALIRDGSLHELPARQTCRIGPLWRAFGAGDGCGRAEEVVGIGG